MKFSLFRSAAAAAALTLASGLQALPILGGNVKVAEDSVITVAFEGYSAAYTSHLYLYAPSGVSSLLFTNKTASVGSSIVLGTFGAGTELVFRLVVQDTGKSFFTGGAFRNADKTAHAKVETIGQKTSVGFEDLWCGGDKDYNDFMFSVTAQPVPDQAATGALLGFGLVALLAARRRRR